jgi:hypothetical protein
MKINELTSRLEEIKAQFHNVSEQTGGARKKDLIESISNTSKWLMDIENMRKNNPSMSLNKVLQISQRKGGRNTELENAKKDLIRSLSKKKVKKTVKKGNKKIISKKNFPHKVYH